MDSLLQEINMLPGVLGCFVYNSKQQVAGKKMPPIFKDKAITSIANLLVRTVQMGSTAELNFTDIELNYNESVLMVTPLSGGALLVIICEPTTNKSLITMTTGMLAKDIEASLGGAPQAAVRQPPVQAATPSQSTSPPQTAPPAEAEIGADLASLLEQIKDALALAIGPIAAPVMKDSIETWAQQNEPSFANIPALAKILCDEINDDDLEDEFMTELKSINT
ncbi:MAG: hypothetical protein DSY80_08295 [Desulfocapsa sp.]|nr:MAG: hypothetical protein DSY80_08295 [Desulfocapsa sp.]